MGIWQITNWFKTKPSVIPETVTDFSIIVPTRERYTLLVRLLDSILQRSYDISRIEILLMSDIDDVLTHQLVDEFCHYNPKVRIILDKQERSPYINENYINKGARLSKGNYLWTLGNDCSIITPHWDLKTKRKIEGFLQDKADRLLYVYIDDDLPFPQGVPRGCSFPMITREVITATDSFMPKEITSYGADHWLWQNFRKIPRHNRILDIKDEIKIEHICAHNHKSGYDRVSQNIYGVQRKDKLSEGEEKFYINSFASKIQ